MAKAKQNEKVEVSPLTAKQLEKVAFDLTEEKTDGSTTDVHFTAIEAVQDFIECSDNIKAQDGYRSTVFHGLMTRLHEVAPKGQFPVYLERFNASVRSHMQWGKEFGVKTPGIYTAYTGVYKAADAEKVDLNKLYTIKTKGGKEKEVSTTTKSAVATVTSYYKKLREQRENAGTEESHKQEAPQATDTLQQVADLGVTDHGTGALFTDLITAYNGAHPEAQKKAEGRIKSCTTMLLAAAMSDDDVNAELAALTSEMVSEPEQDTKAA